MPQTRHPGGRSCQGAIGKLAAAGVTALIVTGIFIYGLVTLIASL